MIERTSHLRILSGLLARHRVVGIVGARQVGKTTLARALVAGWKGPATVFDLENPEDLARHVRAVALPRLLTDLEPLP
jgi:predicted AAA+ superfamily ATPase